MGARALLQPEKAQRPLKRLGIVTALPAEARCFANRKLPPGERADIEGGGWIEVCGIGAKRATRCAESLLGCGATALLSWGTAGGLTPALRPGALVLPRTVIALASHSYAVDDGWHARLRRRLAGELASSDEPLVQSPGVLATAVDKVRLFERSGAVAVDMESAAIGAVAQDANVPFLVVRVVADPLERELPLDLLRSLDAYGRLRLAAFARTVLKRPGVLTDGWRLRGDVRAACATLAHVAAVAGPDLLCFSQ